MAGPLARLYATLGLDAREFNTNLGAAQKSVSGFGKGADLAMGVAAGAVAAGLMGTLGAAREWETAFVGVKKTMDTTGLSVEQETKAFAVLEDQLLDLSEATGVTSTELAGIAETGGAMGIAMKDIESFTNTVALLSRTTNVTSEAAAASLGKIGAVIGMTADEFDNFGNTLVGLGNAGSSTEQEILEVANRMSGTASKIGMTAAEMLGWSSAMADVGINAEAAGSTFQRFADKVETAAVLGTSSLAGFAEVAGMTGAQFQELYAQSSSRAILAVVQGLSKLSAAERMVVQESLQLSGSVLIKDLLAKLTGNVDGLTKSLDNANEMWEENSAMTDEWGNVLGTVDNQVARFWASVNRVSITLGETLMPSISAVTEHGANLVKIFGGLLQAFPAVTAVVTPLVTALAGLAAVRFGARAMGLGGLEHLIGEGIGKAWTKAGPLASRAIGLVGAAAGAIYVKAVLIGEKLMSLIGAAWVAIGRPGSSVMMKATLAGTMASGSFIAGLARGLTVVGIAAVVGEAVNEGLRQAGVKTTEWKDVFNGPREALERDGSQELTDSMRAMVVTGTHGAVSQVRSTLEDAGTSIGDIFTSYLSRAMETINGVIADPIIAEFAAAREAIRSGMGSVKELLKSKPKFISREDRIGNLQRRQVRVENRLRGAIAADDPRKINLYAAAAAKNKLQLQQMRNGTSLTLKDVKSKYSDAGIKIGATWERTQRVISRESKTAADTAIGEAQRTATTMAALDFASIGSNWMTDLAAGITSNIAAVSSAAAAAATAAQVASAGARAAASATPGGGGGGTTVVNAGVLVADQGGLDELDRRMSNRRRLRARGTSRYNDPG